jgi:hypothetical protein
MTARPDRQLFIDVLPILALEAIEYVLLRRMWRRFKAS